MARKASQTRATQWLARHQVAFTEHVYDYVAHGGAAEGADQLALPLNAVIKTLVMQDQSAKPLIVLMHGDCEVSTKNLARQAGCKSVQPCDPATAQRHSGYQVGGTSPFGLRKPMPVYLQDTVLSLDRIYINGGRRGYLIGIDPNVLLTHLHAVPVQCALASGRSSQHEP